jgi:hypothetical protein
MNTEAAPDTSAPSWDQHLESLMGHAGRALDEGDFVEALETLSTFGFPDDMASVSVDRLDALKRQHEVLGERMKRAQEQLQAAMGKSGNSRKAVRAYRRR